MAHLTHQVHDKSPRRAQLGEVNGEAPAVHESSAAGLGFEPRLLGPEPSVLPLDDPATCRCGRGIVAEPGVAQAVPEMELVDAWPPENWHEGGCQATSAAQSPDSDV